MACGHSYSDFFTIFQSCTVMFSLEFEIVFFETWRTIYYNGPLLATHALGIIKFHLALQLSLNFCRYAFKCHPKDKNGKQHLVAVNDIAFNPSYVSRSFLAFHYTHLKTLDYIITYFSLRGVVVTGDNEGYATIWDVIKRRRLLEVC